MNTLDDKPDYDDPLMDEAAKLVVATGIETAGFLVEHFKIGYARACKILDGLEVEGTIAESPTWLFQQWRNVYLDIDGVLLANDKQPALHVYEFIKRLTIRHPVFWLTTHCRNPGDDPLPMLGRFFDDKTMHYLKKIKPAYWDMQKIEAIDFSQPFLWFDDDVFEDERAVLEEHDLLDSLVAVDLGRDPDHLQKLIPRYL